MWKMYRETKTDMKIKFSGEDEIDALDLSNFLKGTYNSLVKITNNASKDSYFKLTFKATEKGSVILELGAVAPFIQSLFANYTVEDIINILFDLIQIIKNLKGQPPKSINFKENTITNYIGEVHKYNDNSINIYTSNPKNLINDLKTSVFSINKREKVSYELNDEKVEIENKEMEYFKPDKIEEELVEEAIFFEKESVKLIGIMFEGKSQWIVKFKGKNIKVSIWDKEYLEKIQDEEIYIQRNIIVNMVQEVLKNVNTGEIVREKYRITKVYE